MKLNIHFAPRGFVKKTRSNTSRLPYGLMMSCIIGSKDNLLVPAWQAECGSCLVKTNASVARTKIKFNGLFNGNPSCTPSEQECRRETDIAKRKRERLLLVASYVRVLFSQEGCSLPPFTQKSMTPRGPSSPNTPAFVWITCTTLASTFLSLLGPLTSGRAGSRPKSAC